MKTLKKISFLTLLFSLLATFSLSTAYATAQGDQDTKVQPETYTLTATVVDGQTGQAVADAAVIVVGNSDLNTVTDANGQFTLENLEAGTYTIKIKANGYQTWTKDVMINADKEIKIKLKPAAK